MRGNWRGHCVVLLMCKLPFTPGQMLDTLDGVKTGLLFGRINVP